MSRSKVIRKSLNPDWGGEEFQFYDVRPTDILKLFVKDYDGVLASADPLGQVYFPMARVLQDGNDRNYSLALDDVPANMNDRKIPASKIVIHIKVARRADF